MKRGYALMLCLCLIVTMIFPSITAAQSKEQGRKLWEQGKELQEKAQTASDLNKAEQKYKEALRILESVNDEWGVGAVSLSMGILYSDRGEYDKAMEYFEKSPAIPRELKDRRGEGQILNNLGLVHYYWGQYDKAEEYYEKSLKISRKLKDRRGEGQTLNILGIVYKDWGHYDKAKEYYEKSLAIKRELKDRRGESQTLNNMGIVYLDWGEYDKAMEYYEKSLALKRELKDRRGEGKTLNNMGNVYKDWGEYDKAMEYYEESLAICRELKSRRGEGLTLGNLGAVFLSRGHMEEALEHFKKALVIYKEISVPTGQPNVNIADLYLEMGDLKNAEPFVKQANHSATTGHYFILKGDFNKAQSAYENLLKSAEKSRNFENLFVACTGLGASYEGLEKYKKAEEFYEKGLQVVEDTRSSLTPAQRKNFLAVKDSGFYRSEPAKGLARVRMKMNPGVQSIDSLEATRARGFADSIAARAPESAKDVPESILKKEEKLLTRLAALQGTLSKTDREKNRSTYDNLSRQVEDAKNELNSFVAKLRKDHPAYAAIKYPKTVGPKESALEPDEVAVILDVSEEGVIAKLIKNKRIADTNFKSWKRKDLEASVHRFREPFEKHEKSKFDPQLAHELYRKLLMRVLMDVPKGTPLILMPDGILATLPFEALVVEGNADWKTGKHGGYPTGLTYLGDLYPISYYQSVTALTFGRTFRNQKTKGSRTLVLADPVFNTKDDRFKKRRVAQSSKLLDKLPSRLMSILEDDADRFLRLRETAELGKAIKDLDPSRTDLYIGMKAEKSLLFKKPLTNYKNLIFATHGYFGNDIPTIQEPVLALTLVNQPKDTYGFLRMSEVLGMKLNADVVALTACQTGLGNNLAGEGVMSMGRAFQYAGAKSVLMSLWSVSEKASVQLVESFFRNLKDGKPKLEALKLARQEIRDAGYDHPFYWAPFILVGEVN